MDNWKEYVIKSNLIKFIINHWLMLLVEMAGSEPDALASEWRRVASAAARVPFIPRGGNPSLSFPKTPELRQNLIISTSFFLIWFRRRRGFRLRNATDYWRSERSARKSVTDEIFTRQSSQMSENAPRLSLGCLAAMRRRPRFHIFLI